MDDLLTVPQAAAELGTSPNVLVWLYRRGVLPMHKRIGVRSNLVRLDDARHALTLKRGPGKPPRESLPARSEGE